MSAKIRLVSYVFLGALVATASLLLVGTPSAKAQLGGMDGGSQTPGDVTIGSPGFTDYCVGNRCAGQTCDEVNNRCVGDVTLQPPMGAPLVGLTQVQLDRFREGRVLFDKTFTAPDGLGPVFNQNSCGSCHNNPLGGSGTITVTRFGRIDVVDGALQFDPLAEFGGSLLNKEAISAECAEVIPVPPTNTASFRLTNSTLGFGLVEAIPDLDIEINALNPPSPEVSGAVHIVPVLEQPGVTKVGRFGWKDQLATVLSFTADASLQEMGITTRILPEDNAPNNDPVRLAACDTVADPEDVPDANGNEFVDLTTDFQRYLSPPPQTPKSGMSGEAIFETIGCADCHIRAFQASDDDELEDAIRGGVAAAYSDFLLHDMAGAGDFIEQGSAGLTELRTTLLWGLRVRDPLWHDGRAAGGNPIFRLTLAINLHSSSGSESAASAQAFDALDPADKDALMRFLDSLGRREFDMDGDGIVDAADVLLVEDCVAGAGPFTADDLCAIADPNQDGFVDAADVQLLQVALGVSIPTDDEDEDEDGDDASSEDDDNLAGILDPAGTANDDGFQHMGQGGAGPTPETDGRVTDPDDRTRLGRVKVSRRGQ